MAAARRSLDVTGCADPPAFDAAVATAGRAADPGTWLRVVGVDDRHGPLDAHRLDRLAPGRPVRAQHRSGAAWMLSTAARVEAGLGDEFDDGWIHRRDEHLRARWAALEGRPALGPVGDRLSALGVTGVTDATPFREPGGPALLAAARREGQLPQRVAVTGGPTLADAAVPQGLARGPVKVVVEDHDLPSSGELVAAFVAARRAGRPVAVHCVTRVALVLALTAWEDVGAVPGDRIEHGSVIPVELFGPIAELGLTVVTQPAFVRAHGDRYLRDVEPDDLPHLYRCGSLLAAGIATAGSTDAPFGPDDPWTAIATAIGRTTEGGRSLGPDEAVDPEVALDRFLATLESPGGPPRTVRAGTPADLVLLDRSRRAALADPSSSHVRTTWIGGRVAHDGG
jgi:predicted amidohydrolase YtcJ